MATTADFKNGLCIEYKDDLWTIVYFQHVKPGKGPAFVRTKLKSLKNGKVVDFTFDSGIKIDIANVERRPYQYLYKDESGYVFMHRDTYEQVSIGEDVVENFDLYKDGQPVEVLFHVDSETALTCELPPFVALEVIYTEPGLKGDTASSTALKKATVETNAVIMVPLFVNQGDRIKIDTSNRSYYERVK